MEKVVYRLSRVVTSQVECEVEPLDDTELVFSKLTVIDEVSACANSGGSIRQVSEIDYEPYVGVALWPCNGSHLSEMVC